jgi:hypothetical protein
MYLFSQVLDHFAKVFLPELSLALEYQGETHYFSTHIFGNALQRQQADLFKSTFANQLGITLVSIPFWWDKSSDSLAATIMSKRPDINISIRSMPIPTEMPPKFQRKFYYIPCVATKHKDQLNPTGWYGLHI